MLNSSSKIQSEDLSQRSLSQATMSRLRNVAIFGASGQVGKHIFNALLKADNLKVTVVTRTVSTASFPNEVNISKGDFESKSFLTAALTGMDAVVITLAHSASPGLQTRIIEAAADASVPFVVLNEFGGDNSNETFQKIPVNVGKAPYYGQVEALGKSAWIGFVTNPWFEYSLSNGYFGIDIKSRSAHLYDDGNVKINTTTMSKIGRSVASFLSLPREEIEKHSNSFVYLSSFLISQNEILESVQRATGTSEDDWNITSSSAAQAVQEGWEKLHSGNFMGIIDILYGTNFNRGSGGDYESSKGTANGIMGLQQENIDDVVRAVVDKTVAV